LEEGTGSIGERPETETCNQIGEYMSYNKTTESMLSFILPTIIKDELEEYCSVSDRTQSQVLRESVYEYLRYVREGGVVKQVG
jgi:hypothetical protein